MNIDHMDALSELGEAYGLLREFQETIDNSMEGDHPMAEEVDDWLKRYERYAGIDTGDAPEQDDEAVMQVEATDG